MLAAKIMIVVHVCDLVARANGAFNNKLTRYNSMNYIRKMSCVSESVKYRYEIGGRKILVREKKG